MGTQGYYALRLVRKLNIPLFVTFYGSDMSDVPKLQGWDERYLELFKVVTQVIVEGPHMKSKLIELGCPQDKVSIVKIGVPIEHLLYKDREPYNENAILKVLMCANFYPKKGYIKALKAIKLMVQQNINIEVAIVGDGPKKNEITDYITVNKLSNVITLLGKMSLDEIYKLSETYHIFFHPSETAPDGASEGGAPTIIIEMQALGLPIISTRHADIPNIIPIENHFLADEYDVEGLVEQFHKLRNISNWNEISKRGRDFVMSEHTNEICSRKMELLYAKFGKN
jgi:colanic acid/amylovoran biosynthesis glycosyltransferase